VYMLLLEIYCKSLTLRAGGNCADYVIDLRFRKECHQW